MGGDGGFPAPSGFQESTSVPIPQEGVTATQYTGSGTADKALSAFEQSAVEAGWEKKGEAGRISISGVESSGATFEKGNQVLFFQVTETDGTVNVLVVKGPKTVTEGSTPSGETTPSDGGDGGEAEGPPTTDVEGEDIPDVPRYPGSVRVGYFSVEDSSGKGATIGYIAEATPEEVESFYGEKMPSEGWTRVLKMQQGGGTATEWEKGDRTTHISFAPHSSYEGYVEITVLGNPP